MRKRLISLCLAVAMVIAMLPIEVMATDKDSVFTYGDGTKENPYQVSTPEQLDAVRNDLEAHYIQTADINLEGMEWVPIAPSNTDDSGFNGCYNGNGFSISNLTITQITSGNQYVGLFGFIENGFVQNVILDNINISLNITKTFPSKPRFAHLFIGGVAGYCEGTIDGCTTTGSIHAQCTIHPEPSTCGFSLYVGGITGWVNKNGSCVHCNNSANIAGLVKETEPINKNDSIYAFCGGIAGHSGHTSNMNDNGLIEKCTNYADVESFACYGSYAGGIVGDAYKKTYACVNHGDISSSSVRSAVAGGISGTSSAETSYCLNYGNISSAINKTDVAEIQGKSTAGGVVGAKSAVELVCCINCGDVSATYSSSHSRCNAGGVVGETNSSISDIMEQKSTIDNCFNLGSFVHADITKYSGSDASCANVGAICGSGLQNGNPQLDSVAYSIDTVKLSDTNVDNVLGFNGELRPKVELMPEVLKILDIIDLQGFMRFLTIKYMDDVEKEERKATANWGVPLFTEDARTIEAYDPVSFAELVKISALLSNASYDLSNGGYLQKTLNKLGAEDIKIFPSEDWDLCYPAHSFSHVTFYQGNQLKEVVIVTLRGSSTTGDWHTDFMAWDDGFWELPKEHAGFSLAKDIIKAELQAYISENNIIASESKILITGHSYGAAVANLLARSLEDTFNQGNIYAYTFAAPNNIVVNPLTSLLFLSNPNIHNFRNVWDPVVHVPIAASLTERYTVFGEQHFFTLEEIGDESEGIFLGDNHNCTHYVNYAFDLVKHTAVDSLKMRYVQIQCPVDVAVYDENGNVVGKITDNQLDESATSIMMFPVGDQKIIFLDPDDAAQLSIIATEAGTMNVIVADYDVVTGEVSATKSYSDIELKENKTFSAIISAETQTEAIELEVVDSEGCRLAVVNEDGTETVDISEEHKHTVVVQNQKEATCTETGYSGDELCSVCETVVKQGKEIPATAHSYENGKCQFCGLEEPAGIPGDVTGDGKADYSDALLILRASIGLDTLTEDQKQIADVNADGKADYSDALLILRRSIGLE